MIPQLGTITPSWLGRARNQTILAGLLFLFLTIISAWPVVSNLDGVIIGEDADVYINPWADWWTLRAWQDRETSLWETEYLFYPQGANLRFHSFSHLNTLLSLAIRPLAGVLPAYNLAILANFVLSGIAMFQLGRYLTGSAVAGILAGIVFVFNSHNQYQSAHPVLVSIWCFPWLTLCLMRAIRENSLRMASLAALCVFLGAATSTVLLVLMVVWTALLFATFLLAKKWSRPSPRVLLLFGTASILITLPLVYPLLRDALANGNSSFLMDPDESIRMDLFTLLIPHWYFWHVRGLYLGIVPAYLGMLAIHNVRRHAWPWALLFIVALLFAIGPKLEILGTKTDIPIPWAVPIIPLLRNTYRFNILVSLALSVLAAYGWTVFSVQLKSKHFRFLAALMMAGAIYIDFTAAPFPKTDVEVSSFYTEFLESVPPELALAVLPSGRQEGKRHMYFQTVHERKITGGVVSRPSDDVFKYIQEKELLRLAEGETVSHEFPDDILLQLKALGEDKIGFLVLDKTLMDVDPWRLALATAPAFEDEQLLVYATEFESR